jgi:hypothetical protein
MDPIKIAGIKNWPTPTKVKDIRSVFGLLQFLSTIHPRICPHCTTAQRTHTQRRRMDMDGSDTKRHSTTSGSRVTSEPVLSTSQNSTSRSSSKWTHPALQLVRCYYRRRKTASGTQSHTFSKDPQRSPTKLRCGRPGALGGGNVAR